MNPLIAIYFRERVFCIIISLEYLLSLDVNISGLVGFFDGFFGLFGFFGFFNIIKAFNQKCGID